MCRYGFHVYKDHLACFACRKAFKRASPYDDRYVTPEEAEIRRTTAPCPDCGQPMADMGLDFRPPRRDSIEHWQVVEYLYRRGFTYHTCGCGAGYRPSRWADVPAFLAVNQTCSAGESLAARFRARRR